MLNLTAFRQAQGTPLGVWVAAVVEPVETTNIGLFPIADVSTSSTSADNDFI